MEVNYGDNKLQKEKDYSKEVKTTQSNMKKKTPNTMSEEMFYHSFVKG